MAKNKSASKELCLHLCHVTILPFAVKGSTSACLPEWDRSSLSGLPTAKPPFCELALPFAQARERYPTTKSTARRARTRQPGHSAEIVLAADAESPKQPFTVSDHDSTERSQIRAPAFEVAFEKGVQNAASCRDWRLCGFWEGPKSGDCDLVGPLRTSPANRLEVL